MRYITPVLDFISMNSTRSGDYTTNYIHVKDEDGYLSKLTVTQDAFERLQAQNPQLGSKVFCCVISFDKQYNRKDGSGSFWMHRELVVSAFVVDSADSRYDALQSLCVSSFPVRG